MKLLELLLENRIDFLKDKYIPLIKELFPKFNPETTFNFIKDKIDPTNNKKYLQWFLNEIFKLDKRVILRAITEDKEKWNQYLSIYDKVKPKLEQQLRDINKLSLEQLKDIALQYKDKQEEILTKNDYLEKKYKIKDDGIFEAYLFKTSTEKDFKMYQLVSTNTEWCTRPNYSTFVDYINRSPLFVFINKQNRSLKYQFHFDSMQFMDKNDKAIDFDKINSEIYSTYVFKLGIRDSLLGQLLSLIKDYIPFDGQVNGFKYYFKEHDLILYSEHSNNFSIFSGLFYGYDTRIKNYQTKIDDMLLIQRSSSPRWDNYAIFFYKDLNTAYGPFDHYETIKDNYIYFRHHYSDYAYDYKNNILYNHYNDYAYDYKNNILYNADDKKLSELNKDRDSEIIWALNNDKLFLKGFKK